MHAKGFAASAVLLLALGCGDDSASGDGGSSSSSGGGTDPTTDSTTGATAAGSSSDATTDVTSGSSGAADESTTAVSTTSSGGGSSSTGEGSSSSGGEVLEPPCPPGLIGEACETQFFLNAAGIALDGDDLYIAPFFTNAVLHHRRDTGLTTVLSAVSSPVANGATVGDGHALGSIGDVAVAPGGPVYVIDDDEDSVVAIDRATGERTLVSDDSDGTNGGAAVGSGPGLGSASSMAWDPVFERIVVGRNSGSNNDAILVVDPDTGDRTILSDNSVGDFNLSNPAAVAVDPDDGTIYVADPNLSSVYAIDPITGARAFVTGLAAGANLGTGPSLGNARVIGVGTDGSLFVGDRSNATVLSVDVETGDRTVIASGDIGDGDVFIDPFYMAGGDGEVLVTDSNRWSVIAVDAATYARTTVFDTTLGEGQRVGNGPGPVATDGDRLFVGLRSADALMEIDPVTGDRTILGGKGPAYDGITDVVFEPSAGTLYVVDDALEALLEVAVDTGDRSTVSGNGVGSGPAFDTPEGVAVDVANDRAFVVDRSLDAVFEVTLSTGERSVFSDDADSFNGNAEVGTGPALVNGTSLVLDADNQRLLIGDTGSRALVAVSLAPGTEGNRTIVSDASDDSQGGIAVGDGPDVAPQYLWLDPDAAQIVVTSDSGDSVGVFTIDLTTGDRAVFSSGEFDVGNGWVGSNPRGVARLGDDLFVTDNWQFLTRIDTAGDRWVVSAGATEAPL